jgi:hypothetical protein
MAAEIAALGDTNSIRSDPIHTFRQHLRKESSMHLFTIFLLKAGMA